MDYGQIIGKAWTYIKKHRFLWWLGLLAIGAEGGSGFGYSGGNFSIPENFNPPTTPPSGDASKVSSIGDIPRVLGASTNSVGNWIDQYWLIVLIASLVAILFYLIIMYIAESAKAGLVMSVIKLEEKQEEMGFGAAFHQGRAFAWRLLGQNILIGLISLGFLFLLLLIAFFPMIFTQSGGAIIFAVVIIILGLIPLMILGIYLNIILRLSSREMVTKNMKIMDSLRSGRKLLHATLGKSIIVALIEAGISIAAMIVFGIASLIIAGILFGIGYGIYSFAGETTTIIYGIMGGLAFLVCLLIVMGIFCAYFSTYWTLAYRALNYLALKK